MKKSLCVLAALVPVIVAPVNASLYGNLCPPARPFAAASSPMRGRAGVPGLDAQRTVPLVSSGGHPAPFIANELIVDPPAAPEDLAAFGLFLQQIEGLYGITIETNSLDPNGIGGRAIERHAWRTDLGPEITEEIAGLYRSAGYGVHLSHAYAAYQFEPGPVSRDLYGGEGGIDLVTDPLMVGQIPYPFGEDDTMGYPDNGGGYVRARYAVWPPDEPARGDVLLVVSDTGLYWRYRDFIANLWQNPGEDLDGDGTIEDLGQGGYEFDLGDLNGVDDDGNGYDDLIGYDFIGRGPDPTHYDGEFFTHGTSVYSVIAAEPYNGIDMAGLLFPGWVKVVPTKVGNGVIIDESAAIEGIYYATYLQAQGHQVVLNMSWGGEFESEPLRYALETFTNAGGFAVAAVGNEPDGRPRYPAAWSNVLAVSASTVLNDRAEFSNFGAWVDLAAPGESVLAAYYFAQEGFHEMIFAPLDGTSFAAPMVSALAAVYWAIHPELGAANLKERLLSAVYTPEDYPWDPPDTWPNQTYRIGGPPQGGFGTPYYGVGIIDAVLLFGP